MHTSSHGQTGTVMLASPLIDPLLFYNRSIVTNEAPFATLISFLDSVSDIIPSRGGEVVAVTPFLQTVLQLRLSAIFLVILDGS